MIAPVTTTSSLRRDRSAGVVAGVCAGIAKHTGIDISFVRIVFFALTFAGGIGLLAYVLLWAFVPEEGQPGRSLAIPQLGGRGGIEVGLGGGVLLLSLLLTLRALGVWWADALTWPAVLIAAGGALLWHEAGLQPSADDETVTGEEPAVGASRRGLGAALVVAAGLVFLGATGALSAARDVLLSVLVVAVVIGVIFGPWIVRLARSPTSGRSGSALRSAPRSRLTSMTPSFRRSPSC